MAKSRTKVEFGDFQTPQWLAESVCARLHTLGVAPAAIVEPTCGYGSFLLAAARTFSQASHIVGIDINPQYALAAKELLTIDTGACSNVSCEIYCGDFFVLDWPAILGKLPQPHLIVGNPPWVTNAELTTLNSTNNAPKNNFQSRTGIDAITGASNFDISEWMLLKLLTCSDPATTTLALLCKTSVARKVLLHTWRENRRTGPCHLYQIDAQRAFGATVDACLLYIGASDGGYADQTCSVYANLESAVPLGQLAFHDNAVVARADNYTKWSHLTARDSHSQPGYTWRSGIKHDCSPVMELIRSANGYTNKLGDTVLLESDLLFPLYKAADIAAGSGARPDRWLLVTQTRVGADTATLRMQAPLAWHYLEQHAPLLDNRQSTIYRGQPRFAIFGVGDYSFSPWKVAISGMHKALHFAVLGPIEQKPVVLDDTCYFLPCTAQKEAAFIAALLNTDAAQEFLSAFIFWSDKRPITAKLLRRLDLALLAAEVGRQHEYSSFVQSHAYSSSQLPSENGQLRLLETKADSLC